ncbi:N-acetyltransferase [Streptococcus pneumoniae]|nr:N-acetyltransferase [Streptococcus pneumoniae]MDG8967905.1 N-acetyltransferase [Streptococcus pneumoniae]HES9599732.1 N-acetyltransferase [Streptococcus pneumoniae]HET2528080.1 N-acetyltransferase [Streptococcus pneumoniae]HET2839932.1 N-acetyltransferase [Streptococcus pneumoniae]
MENKESHKSQEIGNLIRVYNRSKREEAESEAKNRNCCFAFVNTYQFQAPDFYQKHGYKEVFSLQDYLYIRQRYYYQKNL